MSIDFSDYVNCLDEDDHAHVEALESSYHEAGRVMSPRGLRNYLEGMRAMCSLGRGPGPGFNLCTGNAGGRP